MTLKFKKCGEYLNCVYLLYGVLGLILYQKCNLKECVVAKCLSAFPSLEYFAIYKGYTEYRTRYQISLMGFEQLDFVAYFESIH